MYEKTIKYTFVLMFDDKHIADKCICCNGNQGSPCTSNRASRGTKTRKG